jgi:hypothetical protein
MEWVLVALIVVGAAALVARARWAERSAEQPKAPQRVAPIADPTLPPLTGPVQRLSPPPRPRSGVGSSRSGQPRSRSGPPPPRAQVVGAAPLVGGVADRRPAAGTDNDVEPPAAGQVTALTAIRWGYVHVQQQRAAVEVAYSELLRLAGNPDAARRLIDKEADKAPDAGREDWIASAIYWARKDRRSGGR